MIAIIFQSISVKRRLAGTRVGMMHKVFVYGTLKSGKSNHYFLANAKFLGKARVGRNFKLYVSGLPYLVEESGDGAVGEVYEVDNEGLMSLDRLEGHPNFYFRKPVKVKYEDNTEEEALVYLHPGGFRDNIRVVEEY